jgi:membrane associated rhomboid family serine protease
MLPIRDTIPSKRYPVVTHTIIAVNVIIFLVQLSRGPEIERFILTYGLVPARYTVPEFSRYFSLAQQAFSLLSFMFLHGGFWHLLSNMWSLYIFGDNVEDRLGPFRFLGFYLLCGLVSGLTHLTFNFYSNVPTIGASGSIAGVMGAYFILHPRARILTLIPIIFIPWIIEIPAFIFLGIWFGLQLLNAAISQGAAGIAWWAHIGGFVCGMIGLKILLRLPMTGLSTKVRDLTTKKKTHRLQTVRPEVRDQELHLYGTLTVSPYEALTGTRKLVNIPWGFHSRAFRVNVPPGMKPGQVLRLKGLGKPQTDGQRGNLYLKIQVQS